MRMIVSIGLFMALSSYPQTPAIPLSFEAASVKPASEGIEAPRGPRRPGQFEFHKQLKSILIYAYGLMPYQIEAPSWMDTALYDITAKAPRGSTEAQTKLMLQNLLIERFKLATHPSKKEMPIYSLEVAKGGSKLEQSAHRPDEQAQDVHASVFMPSQHELEKDGFPMLPPVNGPAFRQMFANHKAKLVAQQWSMQEFAQSLSKFLDRPVKDVTALSGEYDFALYYTPDGAMPGSTFGENDEQSHGSASGALVAAPSDPAGGDLFSALQKQLGLRLQPGKGPVDVLIVDRAEKTPIEN